MRLYGWITLIVSYQLATFGGHWSSLGGDITNLISHVTLQYHVVKDNVILWVQASHRLLPSCQFGSLRHCGCGNMPFLICHIIL